MKKLILISILAIIVGYAGLVVAYNLNQPETAVQTVKTPSKYEVGPPTAEELLELVNAEREKVGVEPLTIDENVQKSAQLKADDFVNRDYYDHVVKGTEYTLTHEMAQYVNKSCVNSGENIAADNNTSQEAHDDWMGSKLHRDAILSDKYQSIGIGVAREKDGDYYSVQHFCVVK